MKIKSASTIVYSSVRSSDGANLSMYTYTETDTNDASQSLNYYRIESNGDLLAIVGLPLDADPNGWNAHNLFSRFLTMEVDPA